MRLLDRYLLRDLGRTLLISTGILVTVVAFGAAIKPLANDQLLTALQAAKYMSMATVPMLQFALPFSAGFAATLTLHRMTSDNEIQAMSASGIGYGRALRPVLWLGLALLVLMVALTQWVIPKFWGMMHQAIAADVTRIFQASIARGEPFQVDDLLIYADDMAVQQDPEGTDADTRMILVGFAAAELDAEQRIETEVTARQAVVDVYRRDGQTHMMLAMYDTVVFDRSGNQLSRTERVAPETAWTLSSLLEDEPRAMTQPQLLELRRRPDGFSRVAEARERLADTLRDFTATEAIAGRLADRGAVEFVERDSQPRRYVIEADDLKGRRFVRQAGDVEVTAIDGDEPVLRFTVGRLELTRSGTRLRETTFGLLLEQYTVHDLRAGTTNRRS
ncbi:MAG: LptF/LptG family permease, partial [Planctomycetota bacterium]